MPLDDFLHLHGVVTDAVSDKKPLVSVTKSNGPGNPVFIATTPSKPTTKVKAKDTANATIDNKVTPSGRTWVANNLVTTGGGGFTKYDTQPKEGDRNPSIWDILSIPARFVTSSVLTGGAIYQYVARAGGHMFDFSPEGDKIIDEETNRFNKNFGNAWTSQWEDFGYSDADKAKLKVQNIEEEYPDEIGVLRQYAKENDIELTNEDIVGFAEQNGLQHNLDLNVAVQYNLGQLINLGASVINPGVGGSISIVDPEDDMAAMATFDKNAQSWGFVGANINFDPYSDKQRGLIQGDTYNADGTKAAQGNGWNLGNVTGQLVNLTGTIGLDPISYVPVAPVIKGIQILSRGARFLPNVGEKTLGKLVLKDSDNLVKLAELPEAATLSGRFATQKEAEAAARAATGADVSLPYWKFARFAADNNAATILQHPVIKSIPSGERSQVAWLLGQVKTEQDVAKVLLATDYGSTRAFGELIAKDADLALALDETLQGGYLLRNAESGVLNDAVVDSTQHIKFYELLNHYSTKLNEDEFSKVLRDVMVKSTATGLDTTGAVAAKNVAMGTTAARELLPSRGFITNKINNFGAHLGSYVISNNVWEGATIVTRALTKFGSTKLYHQVVRLATPAAKGIINVEDSTGTAATKFFGMVGDIDRLSGGALTKEGLRADLTERWLKAQTPQERAVLIRYTNELGLTKIAEKHFGLEDLDGKAEAISRIVKGLTEKKRIHENNLDATGKSIIVERDGMGNVVGEHIFDDPYMIHQTANNVQLWDWQKVSEAFRSEGNKFLKGFYRSTDTVSNVNRAVNSVWQQVLLLRPARIVRDIYQNYVSIAVSSYDARVLNAQRQWVNGSIGNAFSLARLKEGSLPKWRDRFTQIGSKSSPKEYRDGIAVLTEEQDLLQSAFRTIVETQLKAIEKGNFQKLDFKDLIAHFENAKEIQSEVIYHGSAFGATLRESENVDQLMSMSRHPGRAKLKPSGRFDIRSIAGFPKAEQAQAFVMSRGKAYGSVNPEATLKLTSGPGIDIMTSPTKDKILAELGDGNIVHVRGRKDKPWGLTDLKILAKQTDEDIAKLQVRVISGEALGPTLKRKDLADLITQGNTVWYKDDTLPWTILSPNTLTGLPELLPKNASLRVFAKDEGFDVANMIIPVKTYGDTLTITPVFKDLPVEVRGILGIKSQKDLDKWIATKQYDQLRVPTYSLGKNLFTGERIAKVEGEFGALKELSIGRIRVTTPEGEVIIANPLLSDLGTRVDGKDVFKTSRLGELVNIELQKMGITETDIQMFMKTLDTNLGLGGPLWADVPERYQQIADKIAGAIKDTHSKLPKDVKDFITRSEQSLKKLGKQKDADQAMNALHATLGVDRASLLSTTEAVKSRLVQVGTLIQKLEEGLVKANKRLETRAAQVKAGKIIRIPSTTGDIDIHGVRFDAALAGDAGSISLAQLKKDAADARVFDAHRPYGGTIERAVIKPGEPQYWDAWANLLNRDFRFNGNLDPVIELIIRGRYKFGNGYGSDEKISEGIRSWITDTLEGQKYADAVGIGKKYLNEDDIALLARKDAVKTEGISVDDFIEENLWSVENHIGIIPSEGEIEEGFVGVNTIAEKLLNKELVTPSDLAEFRIGGDVRLDEGYGVKSLPDIWASKANPKYNKEYKAKVAKVFNDYKRITTESSQVYLFQTPLFAEAYRRSLTEQLERFKVSRGLRDDQLKLTDAQRILFEKRARASALKETQKWIYSFRDGSTKFEEALRFIVPFANAQIFTIRSLYRSATDQPLKLARLVYFLNKENHSIQWVDQNGIPVGFDEVDKDGKRKAVATKINLPPFAVDAINKVFGLEGNTGVQQILWSRQSLDPVFQGNYGKNPFGIPGVELPFETPNPFNGFSLLPGLAIGLSELSKAQADDPNSFSRWLTKTFPQLQPYGPSATPGSVDILSPGGILNVIPGLNKVANAAQWEKTVLETAQFLTGALINGDWEVPKDSSFAKELESHANGLFWIQSLSGFFAPVATQYDTIGDIARKTWKAYLDSAQQEYDANPTKWKEKYGDSIPYTVAQSRFLTDNPEMFFATVRQNDRKYNQNITPDALSRIRKYKPILDEVLSVQENTNLSDKYTRETLSFIVNEQWNQTGTTQFDQTVWNTMISEGYINKVTPEEIQREVYLAKANAMYWNTGVDLPDGTHVYSKNEIDLLKDENGILPDGTSAAAAEDRLKRSIANYAQPEVASVYSEEVINPDPQKYDTNFRIWNQIMQGDNGEGNTYSEWWRDHTDKGGIRHPLINNITNFLIYRKGVSNRLNNLGNRTGVYRLSAYPQLQTEYRNQVSLMRQDPDFDLWYYTFFEGDTVN